MQIALSSDVVVQLLDVTGLPSSAADVPSDVPSCSRLEVGAAAIQFSVFRVNQK